MASSSPVFLNYCHEDTGNGFVSHLSTALVCKGIPVSPIGKYSEMRKSTTTTSIVSSAIKKAKLSILIISNRYAQTQYCLDELVLIIKEMENNSQIVIPVFYHVNTTDIEEVNGVFGEAFDQFAESQSSSRKAEWSAALVASANVTGKVIIWPNQKESDSVEEIVAQVSGYLIHLYPPPGPKMLIGIRKRVDPLKSCLLGGESHNIVAVGVHAMAGGGKSTVVDQLFREIRDQFDGCHIFGDMSKDVRDRELSSLKEKRWKKVLIALDGVDEQEHVEFLLGQFDWIGPGSRIVVTTGDGRVLDTLAVQIQSLSQLTIRWETNTVNGFNNDEAHQLILMNTFNGSSPHDTYMDSVEKVIAYAQGNPYALQVLSRGLIELTLKHCESKVRSLYRKPDPQIQSKMESTFLQQSNEARDVFLDVACFFVGKRVDYATEVLHARYCYDIQVVTEVIQGLEKTFLITTYDNCLGVHNLYREMANKIVHNESPSEAGDRSRIWDHAAALHVLSNNTGSRFTKGLCLDICKTRKINLPTDVFTRMYNLRILRFNVSCSEPPCGEHRKVYANANSVLESLPRQLVLLHWHKCPLITLPSQFILHNLVDIHLVHNNLERLWEGKQNLPNLTWINLGHSPRLKQIPDVSEARKLRSIVLEGCQSLDEVDSSIQHLMKLVVLNLKDCIKIRDLPPLVHLEELKTVHLEGCLNLMAIPQVPPNCQVHS
ncbi:Disease resistance-like protein DSC1 [Linum perenne]